MAVVLAIGNFEGDRLVVQPVGFFVACGRVGLLHQIGSLLEVVFFLLLKLLDLLADRSSDLRALCRIPRSDGSPCSLFAGTDLCLR